MGIRGAAIVGNNVFLILLLAGITFLGITVALKTVLSDSYCAEDLCRSQGSGNLDPCYNNDLIFCCGNTGIIACGSYTKCTQTGITSFGISQCGVTRIISWVTLSLGVIGLIGSILIAWQTKPGNNQGFNPYSQNQVYN